MTEFNREYLERLNDTKATPPGWIIILAIGVCVGIACVVWGVM